MRYEEGLALCPEHTSWVPRMPRARNRQAPRLAATCTTVRSAPGPILTGYPWPAVTPGVHWGHYEYLAAHLPEGMGLMACHAGGMYEHLSGHLFLRGAVLRPLRPARPGGGGRRQAGRADARLLPATGGAANLIAVFPGDDMGFRSATLLPARALRQYTLPWHGRFAAVAHERGLPYFLHSCGNLARSWTP